jgi:hypothetical protein
MHTCTQALNPLRNMQKACNVYTFPPHFNDLKLPSSLTMKIAKELKDLKMYENKNIQHSRKF